jgi:hypothetical protein
MNGAHREAGFEDIGSFMFHGPVKVIRNLRHSVGEVPVLQPGIRVAVA